MFQKHFFSAFLYFKILKTQNKYAATIGLNKNTDTKIRKINQSILICSLMSNSFIYCECLEKSIRKIVGEYTYQR